MKLEHFDWKPEYELGVEAIDDQHRHFAGLIDRILVEFRETSDLAYQERLIAELNAYARFHFISEENMMIRANYPSYEQHKAHHRDLLDRLSAKEGKLAIERSEQSKDGVVEYLVDWFLLHTTKEDRLFTDYLHQSNPGD